MKTFASLLLILLAFCVVCVGCGDEDIITPEPSKPKEVKQYVFEPQEVIGYLTPTNWELLEDNAFLLHKTLMIVTSTKRIKNVNGVDIIFNDSDKFQEHGTIDILFDGEDNIIYEYKAHAQYSVLLLEHIDGPTYKGELLGELYQISHNHAITYNDTDDDLGPHEHHFLLTDGESAKVDEELLEHLKNHH